MLNVLYLNNPVWKTSTKTLLDDTAIQYCYPYLTEIPYDWILHVEYHTCMVCFAHHTGLNTAQVCHTMQVFYLYGVDLCGVTDLIGVAY